MIKPARTSYNGTQSEDFVKPNDYSDVGNAQAFHKVNKDCLAWTKSLGWLVWDGKRWEPSDKRALSVAVAYTDEMLDRARQENKAALLSLAKIQASFDAQEEGTDPAAIRKAKAACSAAKAYLAHAEKSRGNSRLAAFLEVSTAFFCIDLSECDANPDEMNTPAGIVNLKSGQIRANDPAAYCTHITAAEPGKGNAGMWDSFLNTVTQGDESIKSFLQMTAGMSLFGTVYHEGIMIAYGGGRNGKSTFYNALGAVLGDYAGNVDAQTIISGYGNVGAALATMRGKRLVISGELEKGKALSTATLKRVASTDQLVIEHKYKDPETVRPSHSMVLFTNVLPSVASNDNGTWRRITIIPFNAIIPKENCISNYAETLARVAGGAILQWAIDGAVMFAKNGYRLDIPDVIEQETENYRAQEDIMENFLSDCCVTGNPNDRTPSAILYALYKDWANRKGFPVDNANVFSTELEMKGYKKKRIVQGKMWYGIATKQHAAISNAEHGRVSYL